MKKYRLPILLFVNLLLVVYIFSKDEILQDQAYHHFADSRGLLGIPNFGDVMSNLPFVVIGWMGLIHLLINQNFPTKKSWIIFFLGILLVGPGSAYYHWAPDDLTLVWDRIPMTIAFMAMIVAIMSEHISLKMQSLLWLAIIFGIASVAYWDLTTDLRWYVWVQSGAILTIPLVLLLYPSAYSHRQGYWQLFVFYIGAKISEALDPKILDFSQGLFSGHTLKHLLAAAGIYAIVNMMKRRKPCPTKA